MIFSNLYCLSENKASISCNPRGREVACYDCHGSCNIGHSEVVAVGTICSRKTGGVDQDPNKVAFVGCTSEIYNIAGFFDESTDALETLLPKKTVSATSRHNYFTAKFSSPMVLWSGYNVETQDGLAKIAKWC